MKNNNGGKVSKVAYVNRTGADIRFLDHMILHAVKTGTELPEDIADIFTLEIIEVEDGIRGLLDFA